MIMTYSPEQMQEIKKIKLAKQQERLAQCGISTAVVNGKIVTVGDYDRRSEERRVGKECRSRWSPYH